VLRKCFFERGELGPIDAIVARGSATLDAAEDWSSMTDQQLLEHWSSAIEKLALDFGRNPESWVDEDSMEFFRRSAVVFGVEDEAVCMLLRNYHRSPKPARVAIFLPIRRSTLFSYIDREINEMVHDVEIDDPVESMRSLIRSVVATR
jgi:hypothetical protein